MRTPRFLLSSPLHKAPLEDATRELTLQGKDFHHLTNVLRRACGDEIELIDSQTGKSFLGTVTAVDAATASVKIVRELATMPHFRCTLFVGLVKPAVLDEIVEKCVEVGVSEICFFSGDHSQQRLTNEQWEQRAARLNRVAEAALKQSGVGIWPRISKFDRLEFGLTARGESFTKSSATRCICVPPTPDEDNQPINFLTFISDRFQLTLDLQQSAQDVEFYLIIGPEGGFSAAELERAKESGFVPVSLGHKVYRTQTAVAVVGALASLAHDAVGKRQ